MGPTRTRVGTVWLSIWARGKLRAGPESQGGLLYIQESRAVQINHVNLRYLTSCESVYIILPLSRCSSLKSADLFALCRTLLFVG